MAGVAGGVEAPRSHRAVTRSTGLLGWVLLALFRIAAGLPALAQAPDSVASRVPGPASADGAPLADGEAAAGEAVVARVRNLLADRRPLSALDVLARELSRGVVAGDASVLLAGEAYLQQRAWTGARRLLAGRSWADPSSETRALRLLARAYLGLDSATAAARVYGEYLARGGEEDASLRVEFAHALAASGRPGEAAEQLAAASRSLADVAHWLRFERLLIMAASDDSAAFALADSLLVLPVLPPDSIRRAVAGLAFRSGRIDRGLALARRAGRAVEAEFGETFIAPHLLETGDTAAALGAYRTTIEAGVASPSAIAAFLSLDPSWSALRLAAEADLRAGRPAAAIARLSRALEAGPPAERPGIAAALADAYRARGDPGAAVRTLAPWVADEDLPAPLRASMWVATARALEAAGEGAAAAAAWEQAAAGDGNAAALAAYLIADGHHDAGRLDRARTAYERAASRFPGTGYGSRALERVALLHVREHRWADAAGRLEEYLRRYPSGSWASGARYWLGRVREAEGDTAAARARYRETISRDPLDYYALLASRRTGEDPWAELGLEPLAPSPAAGRPPDDALPPLSRVHAETLARMNLLRDIGWPERARREYRAVRQREPIDARRTLAFARALEEAGWTREGVAEAWRAQAKLGRWSRTLLEAVYPLPYRGALAAAAGARGLPAHLVAGLTRRESLFDPEIVSSANAVGLMQLLPATARNVAPRAGIAEYHREQLVVPEINLRLGTRYLADLLERFDGRLEAGLIAYNAGPHRYLRWREFPEFSDTEALVERIPFRETREYVRAVTGLAEIYRRLYPGLDAPLP